MMEETGGNEVENTAPETDSNVTESTEDTGAFADLTEQPYEHLEAFLNGEMEVEVEGEAREQEEHSEVEEAGERQAPGEPNAGTREQGQANASSAQSQEEVAERIRQQAEEQQERLVQTRTFVERQVQSWANQKEQLRNARAALEKGLDELYVENPKQAVANQLRLGQIDQELRNIDQKERLAVQMYQAQTVVAQHIGPEDLDLDAMSESLQGMGLDANYINQFRANPYAAALPETIIVLAGKAKAEKALRQVVTIARALHEKNQELERRVKTGSTNVLKQIERAARSPRPLNAARNTATKAEELSTKDPAYMSDEEIQAFLRDNQ